MPKQKQPEVTTCSTQEKNLSEYTIDNTILKDSVKVKTIILEVTSVGELYSQGSD